MDIPETLASKIMIILCFLQSFCERNIVLGVVTREEYTNEGCFINTWHIFRRLAYCFVWNMQEMCLEFALSDAFSLFFMAMAR